MRAETPIHQRSSDASEGARRAALTLHALSHADQRQVLSRLSVAERQILVALLSELQEIGVPADRRLIGNLIDRRAATPTREQTPSEIVASATASEMHYLLLREPALLIARLLSLQQWPWRNAFEALQPLPRRRQLGFLVTTAGAANEGQTQSHGVFAAELLAETARRLTAHRATPASIVMKKKRWAAGWLLGVRFLAGRRRKGIQ